MALFLLSGLAASAQLTKIPVEYNGKHIFIRVGVGSNDSLRFVFDTGATSASIDSLTAESAGIGKDRQLIDAAGHGGVRQYVMALNQTFNLAGLKIEGVNPLLVDFSGLKSTGMKLDGIIGYELLSKYVTALNFDRKELSFYRSIREVDTAGYTGIPFEFNKGVLIPRFPATIKLKTGQTFTGRVMFDSGGFFTLLISTPFNKFHGISAKLPERTLKQSRGMSTISNEERATISKISFGGFELGEMPIDLTVNDQAEPKDGYLGMIGIEIINRFDIILDYTGKKIYMKPNKDYQRKFDFNVGKK